jgi:pumilio RNA-binding family
MSDNYNDNRNRNENNEENLQKPQHFKKKTEKTSRSKTAPIETREEDNKDYIGSYNYFLYYNAMNPKDPKLPKPTYCPKQDTGSQKIDEHEDENKIDPINANQLGNLKNDSNFEPIKRENKELSDGFNYFMPGEMNSMGEMMNIKQWDSKMTGLGMDLYGQMNSLGNPNFMNMYLNNNGKNSKFNQNNLINLPLGGNMSMGSLGGMPPMNFMTNMPNQMPPKNREIKSTTRVSRGKNFYPRNQPSDLLNPPDSNFMNYMNPNSMIPPFNNLNYEPYLMGMNFPPFNMPNQMEMNNNLNYTSPPRMGNERVYNPPSKKKYPKKNENIKKDTVDPPSIDDIIDKVVEYSKDHSGSRLIQKKYQEVNNETRDKIFERLKPEILNLTKDVFGNYVIQKVLQTKDSDKNKYIMESLKGNIYELSTHMYGCRVIQTLLEEIEDEYIPIITSELKDHFNKCIEDQNGNHVVQKLIERLPKGENSSIYNVVLENIGVYSKHQYGCRVIQTLFKKCTEKQVSVMLEAIYEHINELIKDQYGNYIIQYILENREGNKVKPIYDGLKGNIRDYSLHKFASNAIEKALTFGTQQQRMDIINEILDEDDNNQEVLLSMVKDKFGNYVVQKIIEYSDKETQKNIVNRIANSSYIKKKDGFSKHVINYIEKLINSENYDGGEH